MKYPIAACVFVSALCLTSTGVAQPAKPEPVRPAGYDRLEPIAGRWTIKGSEESYLETCRWFTGNFHIVCDTEEKKSDGSVGRGISILGYLPESDTYTYSGIGSSGRNETMSGVFGDGLFTFTSRSRSNGKTVDSRVRMGPFSSREVPFVAETSVDGAPWVVDATFTYIRLGDGAP